ncbi:MULTISPECIES: glutaminyl-peptide cyclotransferase [unclassified Lentimicrobium]|uniref:glutaminyl-peptide cyclotransferase n=1 Tax=unclassified Lentimicrobium TaxID=2677434 RepID=UPI001553824A|nr:MULTISPECIES: glutaminyl-peptide cyclotransferase [unclassified Lentimicrobium]NPD44509.1 hypothetical protein [Lentimicrobium sp. S6]NPD84191.1 hypothetical protein [Lentimicrobium sp. L6]
MKKQILEKIKTLVLILTILLFQFSCSEKSTKNLSSNFDSITNEIYHFGDSLKINTNSPYTIDSIVTKIGNKRISGPLNILLDSTDLKYGKNRIIQKVYFTKDYRNRNITYRSVITIHPSTMEEDIEYEIINEYPHDPSHFTQGLICNKEGNIIESTGEFGASKLLEYNLGSEANIKEVKLSDNYFGEGVASLNGRIYQLTWLNRKGFIYEKSSFEKTREFLYPEQIKQGWGLTTNGTQLILSDGSHIIYFIEEESLSKVSRKTEVLGYKKVYNFLNELEYVDNYIYANILESDKIIKINPKNGAVLGIINLKDICEPYKSHGVLNGIAYHHKNETFIITGKNWPKMFEIKLK